MGEKAAELYVELDGDSRGFNKAMKSSEKRMTRFSKGAAKLKAFVGNVFKTAFRIAAIGVVALTGALVALSVVVKRSMTSIDKLAKTARKLGLLPKELQALRLAAELGGVTMETMDMAMQRYVRRAAEAAMGTGEAVKALKELNINAKEIVKLPVPQQMEILADRFAKVKTQADRVRLAMKLFDSEGVALVNVLASGKKGLQDIQKEVAKYGLALKAVDVVKVEELNDAWTMLKFHLGTIIDRLAVEFAPLLTKAVVKMGESIPKIVEWIKQIRGFIANVAGAVGAVFDWFDALNGVVNHIKGGIATLVGWFAKAQTMVLKLAKDSAETINVINPFLTDKDKKNVSKAYDELIADSKRWEKASEDTAAELFKKGDDLLISFGQGKNAKKFRDSVLGVYDEADKRAKKLVDTTKKAAAAMGGLFGEYANLKDLILGQGYIGFEGKAKTQTGTFTSSAAGRQTPSYD
ncbi:MAG TPA: hypothetical protein ENG14_07020, partial [Thermodesulforhabdus norvegica]|nr:hypothetical protein [Thermodesulforhabdus norvegica]